MATRTAPTLEPSKPGHWLGGSFSPFAPLAHLRLSPCQPTGWLENKLAKQKLRHVLPTAPVALPTGAPKCPARPIGGAKLAGRPASGREGGRNGSGRSIGLGKSLIIQATSCRPPRPKLRRRPDGSLRAASSGGRRPWAPDKVRAGLARARCLGRPASQRNYLDEQPQPLQWSDIRFGSRAPVEVAAGRGHCFERCG